MESDFTFEVTEKALTEIKNQLLKRNTPNSHLRIGVQGAGCSGFKYYLEFEDSEPNLSRDLEFSKQGTSILIDKKSIIYLDKATLDWEVSLMKSGFKIINPSEKQKCGCGKSVSF